MGKYTTWEAKLTDAERDAIIRRFGPAPVSCQAASLENWCKRQVLNEVEAARAEQLRAVSRIAAGRPRPGDSELARAYGAGSEFGWDDVMTRIMPPPPSDFSFLRTVASVQTACAAPAPAAAKTSSSPAASGKLWADSPDHDPRLTSREALNLPQLEYAQLRQQIFQEYAQREAEKAEARQQAATSDKLGSGEFVDIKRDGAGNIIGTRPHEPNIGPNSLPLRQDGSGMPLPFHVSREVPSA